MTTRKGGDEGVQARLYTNRRPEQSYAFDGREVRLVEKDPKLVIALARKVVAHDNATTGSKWRPLSKPLRLRTGGEELFGDRRRICNAHRQFTHLAPDVQVAFQEHGRERQGVADVVETAR